MNKVDRDIANLPDTTVSVKEKFGFDSQDGGAGLFGSRSSTCPTSIPTTCSTSRRRLPSCRASPSTAASWCRAITAPASRPISSRSPRGSTGRACASTSTAMSAVSISSARTRSSSRKGMQVTEFRDGILPWAYQHNVALVLRRVRCRPARRDVRHPARAGIVGPPDAARPEPRHPAASGLPPVCHRQYGRARRYHRPLSRHAADQPGADGPLVDRHHAQLSAARQRGGDRPGQGQALPQRPRAATSSTRWCGSPT